MPSWLKKLLGLDLKSPIPENQQLTPEAAQALQRLSGSYAAPAPTPTPIPQGVFDYKGQYGGPNYIPENSPYKPTQPPVKIAKMIFDLFGKDKEATRAALATWSENAKWDPTAVHVNKDSSEDMGLTQVWENTFRDRQKYQPGAMKKAGALSLEDLNNPAVNLAVAKIILNSSPNRWARWMGWQDKGFKL